MGKPYDRESLEQLGDEDEDSENYDCEGNPIAPERREFLLGKYVLRLHFRLPDSSSSLVVSQRLQKQCLVRSFIQALAVPSK